MLKLVSSSWILSFFILLSLFTRQSYASAPLTPRKIDCQLEEIRILFSDIKAVLVQSSNEMKSLLLEPSLEAAIKMACTDFAQCESQQGRGYRNELGEMMLDVRKHLKDFNFGKFTEICYDLNNYRKYVSSLAETGSKDPDLLGANHFPVK